jgi:K+-sensing histidine kinase KdpD
MQQKPRRRFVAYGIALLAVLLAVLLAWLRVQSDRTLIFPLSFAAVLVSAWFGGLGPGLLAAGLAGVAGAYFLLPPLNSFAVTDPTELIHLGLFALGALLISSLNEKLRSAHQQLDERFREPK